MFYCASRVIPPSLILVPFILFTKCFILKTLPILHHLLTKHLRSANGPLHRGPSFTKKISHPVDEHDLLLNCSYMIAEIWVVTPEDGCSLVNNCQVLPGGGFQSVGSVRGVDDDGCVAGAEDQLGASERAGICVYVGRS
ncbi:hypothetical protein M9H77_13090 [Catharanthus roseus]|uniref:Uncharacterized protein n=1 Tax=Catharanthus roseus TaxID=4058 RepID=A0ACC0BJJ7_CATRO|nr:hypothetical protein M9H77_13090 [Catharanthus roseus]